MSGVIITSLISWALVPKFACGPSLPACSQLPSSLAPSDATCCTKASNYGWRYSLFTIGGLSVLAFIGRFVLFTFHESPKFLVSKGRDAEAVRVVHAIGAVNGAEHVGLTLRDLEEVDERFSSKGGSEGEGVVVSVEEVVGGKRTRALKRNFGHVGALFSSPAMVRLTVLTWVCYAADYWCVFVYSCGLGRRLM